MYEGKVKLIATGYGEVPTAINIAKAFIDRALKYNRFIVRVFLLKINILEGDKDG
ncbi:hypothetical protein [Alkalihalobacillus deserti]|uniref:hypothetical protein n=1 Tax=Alkalihalobacillus deserti TaxID=2879466 RepID=UPI001D14D162|nr:hypothetical protein [Alkalihalobacillus deserti]